MEVIISPSENGTKLSMDVDICDTEAKKFSKNIERIHNMEADLNLTVSVYDENHFLIERNATPRISEKDIEEFKISIKEFMAAFNKLCISEAPTEEEIEFVKNLVEPDMVAMVGTIFCGDGYSDIRISSKVFTLMCNSFIEKYGG